MLSVTLRWGKSLRDKQQPAPRSSAPAADQPFGATKSLGKAQARSLFEGKYLGMRRVTAQPPERADFTPKASPCDARLLLPPHRRVHGNTRGSGAAAAAPGSHRARLLGAPHRRFPGPLPGEPRGQADRRAAHRGLPAVSAAAVGAAQHPAHPAHAGAALSIGTGGPARPRGRRPRDRPHARSLRAPPSAGSGTASSGGQPAPPPRPAPHPRASHGERRRLRLARRGRCGPGPAVRGGTGGRAEAAAARGSARPHSHNAPRGGAQCW